MQFKIFSNIKYVKRDWKELQDDNIYQSYKYNYLMYKNRKSSISNIRKDNTKCAFCVVYENEKPQAIAPLIIDENPKMIRLLGYGTNAGNLDFIYKDQKYVKNLYLYCVERFHSYKFQFDFVLEDSPLIKLMKIEHKFENYYLSILNYDSFYAQLSKSMRQNIRTAYNRLEKDGKYFKLERFTKDNCDKKTIKEINKIYLKRKETWTGGTYNSYEIFIVEHRDIVFSSVKKISNAEITVLKIDGEIAAFFIGYKEDDNKFRVPRLAINEKFSKYSPGIVLINEYLKDKYNFIYDLGRGQESYKTKLHGILYLSYTLINERL